MSYILGMADLFQFENIYVIMRIFGADVRFWRSVWIVALAS